MSIKSGSVRGLAAGLLFLLNLPLGFSQTDGELHLGIVYPLMEETYLSGGIQFQGFFHMERSLWDATAEERGFDVVHRIAGGPAQQIAAVDELIEAGVDGIVLNFAEEETAREVGRAITRRDLPFIVHGMAPIAASTDDSAFVQIAYDNYRAGYSAGTAAAKLFRKQNPAADPVAVVQSSAGDDAVHEARIEGFIAGLKEVLPEAKVAGRVFDNGTTDSAKVRLLELLEDTEGARIFYASSDYRGMGALRAIRLSVPSPETAVLATSGGSQLSMTMSQSTYDPWKIITAFDTEAYVDKAYEVLTALIRRGGQDTPGTTQSTPADSSLFLIGSELFSEPSYQKVEAYVKKSYGLESWMPYCGLVDMYVDNNFDIPMF